MKKIFMPLIAVILLLGVLNTPVVAQTATNETTRISDMDQNDIDGNDDSDKWGLLGLLGLIGFAGLRKTDKKTTYTSTPQNR